MRISIWIAVFVTFAIGCGGKEKPGFAPVVVGGDSTTGGRYHSGGQSGTSTAWDGGVDTAGSSATGGVDAIGGSETGTGGNSTQVTYLGTGSSGTAGSGAGGAGGIGGIDSLAPVVTITGPKNVTTPNASPPSNSGEGVLTGASANVSCSISPSTTTGAPTVDGSTVKITLTDSNNVVHSLSTTTANGTDYTAIAQLNPKDIPFGAITIQCSASDASKQHIGSDKVSTFVDYGPKITVSAPSSANHTNVFSAKGATGVADFDFNIAPIPLTAVDPGAELGNFTLQVGSPVIPSTSIKQDPNDRTHYTVSVTFSDANLFQPLPSGTITFAIKATDSRGATKEFDDSLIVDGTAPSVSISSPAKNAVVTGQTVLKFRITDETGGSGVKVSTIQVNLKDGSVFYGSPSPSAWTTDNTGNYTFTFDSRTHYATADSQIGISVQATDLVGNSGASSVLYLYLDNVPPLISMDPPNIRLLQPSGSTYKCSAPFDPLGAAPSVGTIVNRMEHYRAFVWDLTNGIPSQDVIYFAGVDGNSVHMYAQPDSSKPIVVDTNGDGVCDGIEATASKLDSQPQLTAVVPDGSAQGAPDFNPTDLTAFPPVPARVTCTPDGTLVQMLCLGHTSDMSVVVKQPYGGQTNNSAVVYAVQPPTFWDNSSLTCTGSQVDMLNMGSTTKAIQEGWVCMAVEASDGAKNHSVSAPLPVCFDDETTDFVPSCATGPRGTVSAMTPPTCIADGCVPVTWQNNKAAGIRYPPTISYLN